VVSPEWVIYSYRPIALATGQWQECLRTGHKLVLPAEGDYVPAADSRGAGPGAAGTAVAYFLAPAFPKRIAPPSPPAIAPNGMNE
jgi:hypothetical protein